MFRLREGALGGLGGCDERVVLLLLQLLDEGEPQRFRLLELELRRFAGAALGFRAGLEFRLHGGAAFGLFGGAAFRLLGGGGGGLALGREFGFEGGAAGFRVAYLRLGGFAGGAFRLGARLEFQLDLRAVLGLLAHAGGGLFRGGGGGFALGSELVFEGGAARLRVAYLFFGGFARGAFRFGALEEFGLGGGAALRFLGSARGGLLGGGGGGLALGAEFVFQRGALGLGLAYLLFGGLARGAFRLGAGVQIGLHLETVGGFVGELALRFGAGSLGLLLAYGEFLFEGATFLLRLAGERFGGLASLPFGLAAGLQFRLDLRAALRLFGGAGGGLLGGGGGGGALGGEFLFEGAAFFLRLAHLLLDGKARLALRFLAGFQIGLLGGAAFRFLAGGALGLGGGCGGGFRLAAQFFFERLALRLRLAGEGLGGLAGGTFGGLAGLLLGILGGAALRVGAGLLLGGLAFRAGTLHELAELLF